MCAAIQYLLSRRATHDGFATQPEMLKLLGALQAEDEDAFHRSRLSLLLYSAHSHAVALS